LLKRTKLVAHYTHTFTIHANATGWEAHTLVSQYTQELKKHIRLALVLARTKFASLAEVLQLALKVNNEINGADVSGTPTSSAQPADPDAMDTSAPNSRIPEAKRSRLMRMGLCF
jgi:hypothetical protein